MNGVKEEVIEETNKFLDFHSLILSKVKKIRKLIASDISEANSVALECLNALEMPSKAPEAFESYNNKELWTLLSRLFHLQAGYADALISSFGSEEKASNTYTKDQ